ncbi:MAG TPA: XRE family transcriptional regulator [Vitreimonas sp.]|uniref:helix-turn-helix domain-containing protein n=1 Tax=Vitreimonas sp. TaxID=3069702 RepID=UPI002D31ABD6|nr:XRE family transcriptional regulator [Vitreimonas sp.]HYD86134.1 XRE family transcriptional regulator [Vitreimonas sp.]
MAESGGIMQARPGAVVREERLRRGWTLADASARTGLPISTLSKVENDKISLSYDKLVRLSQGLEIDISRLFGGGDAPQQRSVIGRRSVTRQHEGRSIETPNYNHRYVAADLLSKAFIPVVAEIRARSLAEFGELVAHPGEEFAYVLEGTVDLHTALYAPVRLNPGDSIYFDSGMGHAYIAVSEGVCRVLSICTGAEAQLVAATEGRSEKAEVAEPIMVGPRRAGAG